MNNKKIATLIKDLKNWPKNSGGYLVNVSATTFKKIIEALDQLHTVKQATKIEKSSTIVRCQHKACPATVKWRAHFKEPSPTCKVTARYIINDKHYCNHHAGKVALKILVSQNK